MKRAAKAKSVKASALLIKRDPALPALLVTGRQSISVRAGTTFAGRRFATNTAVQLPDGGLEGGCDYGVVLTAKSAVAEKLTTAPIGAKYLGGFHFAPGGNAKARGGGDERPAINPRSIWDRSMRPSCPDPRGMVMVDTPRGCIWVDIYLTGVNHLADGTSRFGAPIADGGSPPAKPGGGHFSKFDYDAALAVMKHHGKGLLSFEEFGLAAYGVAEKTARGSDPETTGLDAPRTSKCGLMQATGNLWTWGHDGDPDKPRASIFGGSWLSVADAGSRYAYLDYWPVYSNGVLGARGRCDPCDLIVRRDSAGRRRR